MHSLMTTDRNSSFFLRILYFIFDERLEKLILQLDVFVEKIHVHDLKRRNEKRSFDFVETFLLVMITKCLVIFSDNHQVDAKCRWK